MGLGDCLRCVKYLLFVFNLIFCLIGLVILAFGIWFFVDPNFQHVGQDVQVFKYVAIFLMVIGGIITIIGFLGCCGAIFENRCLLVLFFVLLLLIFLCLVAAGIIILVFKGAVVELVEDGTDSIFQYRNDTSQKEAQETIQLIFHCCGGRNAEKDYTKYEEPIPDSCHPNTTTSYKPCPPQVAKYFGQLGVKVAIGILVTAFVALLGMVFSMMLCCAISDMV